MQYAESTGGFWSVALRSRLGIIRKATTSGLACERPGGAPQVRPMYKPNESWVVGIAIAYEHRGRGGGVSFGALASYGRPTTPPTPEQLSSGKS